MDRYLKNKETSLPNSFIAAADAASDDFGMRRTRGHYRQAVVRRQVL